MRILLVEDHESLRKTLAQRLHGRGYAVDHATRCEQADALVFEHDYGVLILDRMLPDGDSIEHLARWRAQGLRTPALFLTAKDSVADRIEGLEAGSDDYLVKPFAVEELLARIAAISRRQQDPLAVQITAGQLTIDLARREVRHHDVLFPLRPKEFTLLELLARRVGSVVSKDEILEECWDHAHEANSNVEQVLVAALRRKLGAAAQITTVRGAGYRLEQE